MRKFTSIAAACGIAAVLAISPAAIANAAPLKAAATPGHYTLSVTGNGKHATIVYISEKISGTSVSSPTIGDELAAKLPWKKTVSAKADVFEVVATAKTGTKISCSIRNSKGHLLTTSTSYGKDGVATCIIAKSSLLSSLTGTMPGSSASTGTSSGVTAGS